MTLTGAHETLNHVILGVEALAGAVGNSTFPDLPVVPDFGKLVRVGIRDRLNDVRESRCGRLVHTRNVR
jgi:hypothetical protein